MHLLIGHKSCQRISLILGLLLSVGPMAGFAAQTRRIKPPDEHQVFTCKRLINPQTGAIIEDAAIEVNGGRVLRVGKRSEIGLPEGAKLVDYGDKYVIPGLIDTHGHLYGGVTYRQTTHPAIPNFYLAAGVTSIGAPGSMDPGGDLAMRNRINSGLWAGPRYYLAGEYLEMAPVTVGWMNPLSTPEEARLKVDRWAAEGGTMIKIYAQMHGDVLKAAIDEAHEHGMRVVAHIGAVTYKEAIEMGVDELFHGVLAMSDTRPKGVDQRDFDKWGQETAELNLNDPEIQIVFKMAAESRVVLCPTAVVMEPLDDAKDHLDEQRKYYTPEAWQGLHDISKKFERPFSNATMEKQKQFIKMASDAHCLLSTGTDLVIFFMLPGYSLWREMDIFAEAGLTPIQILRAATINGAYALGRTDQLGTVEPGKLADFVVLDADPTIDIHNVRKVSRVVKGGTVYDPEQLRKPWVGRIF
jgi:imidazolonepropionase-like amidohydrolase